MDVWDSKKLRALERRPKRGDHISTVIDVHLRLEHTLVDVLEAWLPQPGAMDLDRLSFQLKASLAAACGLLPERYVGALLYVNRIRNRLAHDLEFTVDESHVAEMQRLLDRVVAPDDDDEPDPRSPLERFLVYTALVGGLVQGSAAAAIAQRAPTTAEPAAA